MLAFDADEMFKGSEFYFSDTSQSLLGHRPNPDDVMELEHLLFNSDLDQFDSQLQAVSGSIDRGLDQEDGCGDDDGELHTSYDPHQHRTDSPHNGKAEGEIESGQLVFQNDMAVHSNRHVQDHNYDQVIRSNDEADFDSDSSNDDTGNSDMEDESQAGVTIPMTRQRSAAATARKASGRAGGTTEVNNGINKIAQQDSGSPAKRPGLRPHPTRKRCLSTSSITSLDMASTPATGRKKRKPSGCSSTTSHATAGGYSDKAMTRNAIAARENRERKKAQFREMEERVADLEAENEQLRQDNECKARANAALIQEVKYLTGVVQNAPEISALIHCIRKAPGVKELKTSFGSSLRSSSSSSTSSSVGSSCRGTKVQDENETPIMSAKSSAGNRFKGSLTGITEKTGVCMHVVNGCISLEFCASCSKKASKTLSK